MTIDNHKNKMMKFLCLVKRNRHAYLVWKEELKWDWKKDIEREIVDEKSREKEIEVRDRDEVRKIAGT